MIWRSSLTHQDYMKYDAQPMTTKFSIRTGKTKTTQKEVLSTNDFLAYQQQQKEDTPSDQDKDDEGDSMDDDEEEGTQHSNSASPQPNQKVLFLNFTSDLSPQTTPSRKKPTTPTKKAAYRVNGVNILNRKNLDSKTAIERIQRRRENHNHVERRRRDTINNTIFELSQVVPNALHTGQKPHKGNILKATLDYILVLQAENQMYQARLAQATPGNSVDTTTSSPPSASFTLPPPPSIPSIALSPLSPVSASHPPNLMVPPLRMSGFEKTYGNTCRY